jgi:hypothetical protein
MILAAMIAYYAVAIGLIFLVGYVTYRQGARRMQAASDAAMARMQAEFGRFPALEPYVREPLPEPDETTPELFISIRRHPETDLRNLPASAGKLIALVSRIEKSAGGQGLVFDLAGSREEKDKLILRLVPNLADPGAENRLARVAKTLNAMMFIAREGVAAAQADDIAELSEELVDEAEVPEPAI